jgi:hypothetical protein
MLICRDCGGDVRHVCVRVYASQRDAYVHVCVPSLLLRVDVDDAGHRANARANGSSLRVYVRVCVRSFSLLLLLNFKIVKAFYYTPPAFVITKI